MIELSEINLKIKNKIILEDINLSFPDKKTIGVVGKNGSGKSTLLKIMAGIIKPTNGKINVLNYVPYKRSKNFLKKISFVNPQKGFLDYSLPAIDFYKFLSKVYKINKEEFENKINYLGKILDIEKKIYQPVRLLSFGERVKCEILAKLLHSPKLIFLDEPFIGLDIDTKKKLIEFLKIQKKEDHTIFIVTHEINILSEIVDELIILDKGRVLRKIAEKEIEKFKKLKKIIYVFSDGSTKSEIIHESKIQHISLKNINSIQINDITIEDILKELI